MPHEITTAWNAVFVIGVNVTRANSVPPAPALNSPASPTTPVPVPSGNVAEYVTVVPNTTPPAVSYATRAVSVWSVVSTSAGAVLPDPIAACVNTACAELASRLIASAFPAETTMLAFRCSTTLPSGPMRETVTSPRSRMLSLNIKIAYRNLPHTRRLRSMRGRCSPAPSLPRCPLCQPCRPKRI